MIPFFIGAPTFLNAFSRSRYSLGLEIVALRQQPGILNENILVLSCESGIEYSGLFSAVIGPHGGTRGLSSNRKRLSPGIWRGEEVSRLMRNLSAGTDHCLTLRRTSEPVSVPRGILDFSSMQHPGDPSISRARRPGRRTIGGTPRHILDFPARCLSKYGCNPS